MPTFKRLGRVYYRFPDQTQPPEDNDDYPWLRSRDVVQQQSDDQLCTICNQLDFTFLFSPWPRLSADDQMPAGIFLGPLNRLLNGRCELCRHLADLIEYINPLSRNTSGNVEVILGITSTADQMHWDRQALAQSSNKFAVSLQLALENRAYENSHSPSIVRLEDREFGGLPLFCGQLIPQAVDIEKVRSWILDCMELENMGTLTATTATAGTSSLLPYTWATQAVISVMQTLLTWLQMIFRLETNAMSPSTPKVPMFLRFVDVIEERIVDQINNPRFAALSSVWGDSRRDFQLLQQNMKQLKQKNQVAIGNPRIWLTIRDAMRICKSLEIRYLWVDCLCIIQDSNEDKKQQWTAMHQVYENAILTIVTAAGSNADAGLPGVSTSIRRQQQILQVQGLRLALKPAHLKDALDRSAWATRAWTMQEGLISRRKLIFTQDQAYFQCEHGDCPESLGNPIHLVKYQRTGVLRDDPYWLDTQGATNWGVYSSVVSDYTKRSIFQERDILYAFQAVSEVLKRDMFGGRPFLVCMPLCMLDVSLLWTRCNRQRCSCPLGGLRRRDGNPGTITSFPSWSWAGWVGHVDYNDPADNLPERTISRVTWLDGQDGQTELSADTTGEPPNDWPQWEDWEHLSMLFSHSYYVLKRGDPNRHFSYPMDLEFQPQRNPMNQESGTLSFRSEVAYLKVSNERHSLGKYQIENMEETSKNPLKLVDERGIQIGVVFEDSKLPNHDSTTAYCFIKLSQTTVSPSMLAHEPTFDMKTRRLLRPGQTSQLGKRVIEVRKAVPDTIRIFDLEHYGWEKGWCLYNVLMIQWCDGIAKRIGIGKVHIEAFDQASPETRSIVLG